MKHYKFRTQTEKEKLITTYMRLRPGEKGKFAKKKHISSSHVTLWKKQLNRTTGEE